MNKSLELRIASELLEYDTEKWSADRYETEAGKGD